MKVSDPDVLPLSATLIPVTALAWPWPVTALAGAVIAGAPLTVTAMALGVAAPPLLSLALSVMVSEPAALVSVRVARSAFTWASEPVIVRLVVPAPLTPLPVADSRPKPSLKVTVKLSPPVGSTSARLTPAIAELWFWPIVSVVGAESAGVPLIVRPTVCGVATPPRPSLALKVMVSVPAVPSVSVRVARSAFT